MGWGRLFVCRNDLVQRRTKRASAALIEGWGSSASWMIGRTRGVVGWLPRLLASRFSAQVISGSFGNVAFHTRVRIRGVKARPFSLSGPLVPHAPRHESPSQCTAQQIRAQYAVAAPCRSSPRLDASDTTTPTRAPRPRSATAVDNRHAPAPTRRCSRRGRRRARRGAGGASSEGAGSRAPCRA
eukprot:2855648-Prymnesium_polylepis.2